MDNSSFKDFMTDIMKQMNMVQYVKPEEIPNIALYMDQVTTFMDDELADARRHGKDKIMTKTMINNYTKNDLLPPPDKKRYSREHVLMLIFIYYFKNILSISDIQAILNPISATYFGNKDGLNLQDIYREVFDLESQESPKLLKALGKKYMQAEKTFQDFPEEDRQYLQTFSFICLLSYDVYMEKMIIEHMIDDMHLADVRLKGSQSSDASDTSSEK